LLGPYLIVVVLFLIGVVASSGFAREQHLQQLAVFASLTALAALGQTLVIIGGGIDLSVPWLMSFGGVQLAQWVNAGIPEPLALVMVVCVGGMIGAVNAAGIAWLRIPPIVMTLGVGGVLNGYLLHIGQVGEVNTAPKLAADLTSTNVGPVPLVAVITLVLALVVHLFLRHTVGGRWLYGIGINISIARLAGVKIGIGQATTYVVSGAMAAFAGVLLAGYVGQSYVEIGEPYLFTSIAAVAIGGASILGGTGTYWGTIAGALTLTLLTAVLALLNLGDASLDIVYGVIIVIAVFLAQRVRPTTGGP
jgi:ribose transport system permease protein